MKDIWTPIKGAAFTQLHELKREYWIIILLLFQSSVFLFLVSLFALTGSYAPTALIVDDHGTYATSFAHQLETTDHSFRISIMTPLQAKNALQEQKIVDIITIPKNFTTEMQQGGTIVLQVQVDNVNTDFTDDIQRALPAAVVAFGNQHGFYGIQAQVEEHDLITHDIPYLSYLVVSGLALDIFVIVCSIEAGIVAREFEHGTITMLRLAPSHLLFTMLGKYIVGWTVSCLAIILISGLVIIGYGIHPQHPFFLILTLFMSSIMFSALGIVIGIAVKRILPSLTLIFGISIPLYLISGSLEPERFDGNFLWILGHASPVYYVVSLVEYAFHGIQVTPEPIALNLLELGCWSIVSILAAILILRIQWKQ